MTAHAMTKAERIEHTTTDDSAPVFHRTHSSLNLPDRRKSGGRRTLEPSLMERVAQRLRNDFSVRHLAAIAAAIGVMTLVVWWVNIAVDVFTKHCLGQNIGLAVTRTDEFPSPAFGNFAQGA